MKSGSASSAVRPAQFEADKGPVVQASHSVLANEGAAKPPASRQPADNRTVPTIALQPAEAAAEPGGLQLVPDGEEFGKLPEGSPFEAIAESGTIKLRVRRSMLMRTKVDVYRTAIVDEAVCDIVQFTPREISLIGRSAGPDARHLLVRRSRPRRR